MSNDQTSPLAEADPNSINDLLTQRVNDIFNKRPLTLTAQDLNVTVEYFRRERRRFLSEAKVQGSKLPRQKKAAPSSIAGALSAKDLLED